MLGSFAAEGDHVDTVVGEWEPNLVTFTGISDGKTRLIGKKTERNKQSGRVYCSEEGMFDQKGKLHSFDEEGIHFMCKTEFVVGCSKFEGFYIHGKRNGEGVQTWEDGEVYKGQWKNGEEDGPFEIESTIIGRKVTIFKNYNQGEEEEFGKVFFHDDASIYIGPLRLNDLNGKGILLDEKGIHVGEWKDDAMVGIEFLHLCDKIETVIELEHAGDERIVEVRRSTKNPLFRIEGDSALAHLQMKEVAIWFGKKRIHERLLLFSGGRFHQDVLISTWF